MFERRPFGRLDTLPQCYYILALFAAVFLGTVRCQNVRHDITPGEGKADRVHMCVAPCFAVKRNKMMHSTF